MVSVKSCVSCSRLTDCAEVDVPKLEAGYHCPLWDLANEPDLKARMRIVNDFGPWALGYGVKHLQPSAKPRSRRRRKNYAR